MSKADYLKRLRLCFPEEPDTVLELDWHFHDMEKTKRYIQLLGTCNTNADIAKKAVREMYVAGDIDEIKAKNKQFIMALLPFTCLDKEGKAHSIAYHIKSMLDDPEVRAERRSVLERRKATRAASYQVPEQRVVQVCFPTMGSGIFIQVSSDKRVEEFFQKLLELARLGLVRIIHVQGQGDSSVKQGQNDRSTTQGSETSSSSNTPSTFYVNKRRKLQALSMASAYIQNSQRRQSRNIWANRSINKQGVIVNGNKFKASAAIRLLTKSVWVKPRDMRSVCDIAQGLEVDMRVLSDRETKEIIGQHKGIAIMKMK